VEQVLRLGETDRMTQLIARSIGDGKPLARVRYERAFGRPIDEDFGDVVARLAEAGLVDDDGTTLALSELGKLAYDVVTLAFYPPHAREWLARRGERYRWSARTPRRPRRERVRDVAERGRAIRVLTHEQQETLTRVGRGTPMGELLRRYWHPVVATSELAMGRAMPVGSSARISRCSGPPAAPRSGRCPLPASRRLAGLGQRRRRLAPVRISRMRFAPDGACLELPSLSGDPALCERARIRGHRVEELAVSCGPIWARGPRRCCRVTISSSGRARSATSARRCAVQLAPDHGEQRRPVHLEWLHGHHLAAVRRGLGLPTPARYARRHVEIGFDIFPHGIIKRRVLEGRSHDDDDWRIGHALVFPACCGSARAASIACRSRARGRHPYAALLVFCYLPGDGVPAPVQEEIPVYEVPFRTSGGQFLLELRPTAATS
jgi:5,5'-dehydrodivanillate O-demethylase